MRYAFFAAALGLLLGCGDALSSRSGSPKHPPILWADLDPNTVVELTPAQQTQSGAPVLASFTIPGHQQPGQTAFDTAGNLWIADGYGYVNAYTPSQLAQATTAGAPINPAITLAINSDGAVPVSSPDAVTFDAKGDLWVADIAFGSLYMYPPSVLRASGAPNSTYTLTGGSGGQTPLTPYLYGPRSLAFDQSGILWVAANGPYANFGVIGYRPSTLAMTNGGPAPDYALYGTPGADTPLCIAFDAKGDLWVAEYRDTVAMFSSAAMAGVVAGNSHPLPSVVLVVPGGIPNTLAFDSAGNLWVAASATKQLLRFPVGSLATGGQPDVRISLPLPAWGLSFAPPH
jgi:sugar lactone lactonase YvrE